MSEVYPINNQPWQKIFGVEVDFVNKKFTRLAGAFGKTGGVAFDNVHCFGGRRRCNVTNEGKVVSIEKISEDKEIETEE